MKKILHGEELEKAPRFFRIEELGLRAALIHLLQMIEKGGFVPHECIGARIDGSSKYCFLGIRIFFLHRYDAAPKFHHATRLIGAHGFDLLRYSPRAATFDGSGLTMRSIILA